jgi:hypothetical protein
MTLIQFLKAGKETPVMLDFIEETLDQMPLLIQLVIVFSLFFSVLARWDHCFGFVLRNTAQEFIRVIRAIRNDPLKTKRRNQVVRLSDVMALPAGQQKTQRVAQGIYTGVDLGAEPASAASKGLVFLPTVFLKHLRRKDALAQWYYRARFAPDPDHWRNVDADPPTPRAHTNAQSVCRPYSSSLALPEACAIVRRFARSTK